MIDPNQRCPICGIEFNIPEKYIGPIQESLEKLQESAPDNTNVGASVLCPNCAMKTKGGGYRDEDRAGLYVRFHADLKEDPALEEAGREEFRKLELGDQENRALWARFREASLKEYAGTYEALGVAFDVYKGESEYESELPRVLVELTGKRIASESEGALVAGEDHLQRLPREGCAKAHPAVAQPQLGHFHRHRHAGDLHLLVAPIELERLARRKRVRIPAKVNTDSGHGER